MNSQSTPGPRQRHNSVRHQARLDPDTSTKLEELASTCHRKRSAILRYVIQWGITHTEGWIIDRSPVVAVPLVAVLLEAELLQQVQDAAAARGVSMAAWLREAVRQVSVHDLPASWRTGETAERSHDSGYYERSSGDWSEKPVRRSGDCGDNSSIAIHRSAISPSSAFDLHRLGSPAVSGAVVAQTYGLLSHYTTLDRLAQILAAGHLGGSHGCWLTTTPYAACMAPYNLGLDTPRDICLLVDVHDLQELWGPGTCPPLSRHPRVWRGGGIEFFSPIPIPFAHVKQVCEIAPCGDCYS